MRSHVERHVKGPTRCIDCATRCLDVARCASPALLSKRAKAIQQKLDRLDDAFIYKESIDLGTYERQRDRLREELTLVEIDRHGSKVEEFDVEGILNFAERVLPRASDLWYRRRWSNGSGFSNCFFRKVWRSAEKPSIEPSYRLLSSITYGRSRGRMKMWWGRLESNRRRLRDAHQRIPPV